MSDVPCTAAPRDPPGPRLALLFSALDSPNHGVNALTYAALDLLADAARDLPAPPRFTLCGTRCRRAEGVAVTVGDRTLTVATEPFGGLSWRALLHPAPARKHARLAEQDLWFDLGEGDSFTDLYGFARFTRYATPKFMAARLRRPLCLLPQTVGPFQRPSTRRLAAAALRRCATILARDAQSRDCVTDLIGGPPPPVFPDMAFYLPFKPAAHGPGLHVGLNPSGLLWHGGYRDAALGSAARYAAAIEAIARQFSATAGVSLHLVPHVIAPAFPVEDDRAVCEQLAQRMPGARVAPAFGDPIAAKNYIAGLDFFVGSRMHACIAAFAAGVPIVPLAYSRKFAGLFTDTLGYTPVPPADAPPETLAAAVAQAWDQRADLRERVRAGLRVVAPRRADLVARLASILATSGCCRGRLV